MNMAIVESLFRLVGGLSLFMYGIKMMSDALQRVAGKRLQSTIGFMTANRFAAVLSGIVITAIVQSSSAVSVIVVSFVSAQLLTLPQAIGVIMGANIGTTFTAWIVAMLGFSVDISALALPSVAVGFILRSVKGKRQSAIVVGLGDVFLGAGVLFLGLEFLTNAIPSVQPETVAKISVLSDYGFLSIVMSVLVGAVVTAAMNSSSATVAIIITLAHEGVLGFDTACAMTLGANIGTTINAPLAAIGGGSAAARAALVHVLFNIIGAVVCVIFFRPVLSFVDMIVPGLPGGELITLHVSAFHSVFNILSTLVFLPFVNQYAAFICFLVKDKGPAERAPYRLDSPGVNSPELAIVRAEKELRDLAALVFAMYQKLRSGLDDMRPDKIEVLTQDLLNDENYADTMREELTDFLMQITRTHLNAQSEHNVALLLRIIADLEDMTDDCYSIGMLLLRNAQKNRKFKGEEMDELIPYMSLIESFLSFVREHLGGKLSQGEAARARKLENEIDENRNKLRRLAQKRIEAGKNVKTELAYIDLVRRLERLGDFCNGISSALSDIA
ncbi:MAG: Na/Pi cotransporter family protein [Spirochaetaceae bacterium]|jgi:phosphate:Na+ symporter|nr:Na/Pi cotransporter family protein [Spirochaetaceae bacterium]